MSNYKVMDVNDDLAIRTSGPVHSGNVRSVYRLSAADSRRLIEEKGLQRLEHYVHEAIALINTENKLQNFFIKHT